MTIEEAIDILTDWNTENIHDPSVGIWRDEDMAKAIPLAIQALQQMDTESYSDAIYRLKEMFGLSVDEKVGNKTFRMVIKRKDAQIIYEALQQMQKTQELENDEKIDLKEQLKSLFDTGINLNICQIRAIQWAINQVAIPKTETTSVRVLSCWYCTGIESHSISTIKTVTDEYGRELSAYDTPYNYCPNCGRKLKEN